MNTHSLEQRYSLLETRRSGKLHRARVHAEHTIPALLPYHGFSQHQELPVPYNSVPAEGANNLASRMVSVVWPLGSISAFNMIVNPPADADPVAGQIEAMQKKLTRFEQSVMRRLSTTNLRTTLFMAMLHLIIVGDVLVHQLDDYSFRVFRLDQYVVRRTSDGQWNEIIIKEMVDPDLLPERIKSIRPNSGTNYSLTSVNGAGLECLYTQIKKQADGTYAFKREFRGTVFDQNTRYTVVPYYPMRWSAMPGEDYGRSFIEDTFGDVRSLDSLTKSLNDGSALNAEHRWGVNPAGITEIQDLIDSINGDYVPVAPGDVEPLQFQNHSQVDAALRAVTHRENALGRRFLMNSVAQPKGERVTATQVRLLAEELENNLGGVLSMASRDILIPIIRRTIYMMTRDGLVPNEIGQAIAQEGGILEIDVRAGLEVLRREAEFERLSGLVQTAGQLPERFQAVLDEVGIMNRWVTGMNIEPEGIILSREQVEANRAAEAQQMQAQQLQQAAIQTAQQAATQPQGAQVSE